MRIYVRIKRSNVSKKTKILSTRMIYKLKKNLMSKIVRYKTRYVVQSFQQKKSVNFNEIYVVVVKVMFFKTLFVLVIKKDLECEQVDIIIAFLNFLLQEEIYVESSKDYRENNYV